MGVVNSNYRAKLNLRLRNFLETEHKEHRENVLKIKLLKTTNRLISTMSNLVYSCNENICYIGFCSKENNLS